MVTIEDAPRNNGKKKKKKKKGEVSAEERESILQSIQSDQIFIGMVFLKAKPRPEIRKSIERLNDAGIRFVFFSGETENRCKTFGEKLGLETDWNCCISLSDKPLVHPRLNSNNIAHLPVGLTQVREHLEQDIDNVPLLVPIFCDSTPDTTTEMIRIFQEYGDVVLSVGSALDPTNLGSFAHSDCSISNEPVAKGCVLSEKTESMPLLSSSRFVQGVSSGSLSCDMTSLSCDIIMSRRGHLYECLKLIEEGRHVLYNIKQVLLFYCVGAVWLHASLLLNNILFPSGFHLLSGFQILWLILIILPLQAFPFLTGPKEDHCMERIPTKNIYKPSRMKRSIFWLLLRSLHLILFTTFIFGWGMTLMWKRGGISKMFGQVTSSDFGEDFDEVLLFAQSTLLFLLTIYMAFLSLGFYYHQKSIFSRPVRLHRIYLFCILLSLLLQLVFSTFSLISQPLFFDRLSWEFYLVAFLYPLVIIFVDELVKRYERKWTKHSQDERRLEFETKLGR